MAHFGITSYFGVAPLGHTLFTKTMIIYLEMKHLSIYPNLL